MDLELLSMMPHQIGYEPYVSRDDWSNKTYGAIVLLRGRIENKRRRVLSANGKEIISETTLYLATTSGISIEGRITLPSGYLPATPDIIAIARQDDEYGAHHTVVYV